MLFVKKHLPDKFYIENDQRKDLREFIFREIIGNIIVHREYTSQKSSDFIIYKDKVEATNPNKVVFRGILQLDTFSPYPKNPNIRKFFTEFRWTDEIGSGVKNVNKYLKLYADGAKPLFIEDDDFKTIIPLKVNRFEDKSDILLDLLGLDAKQVPSDCAVELRKLPLSDDFAQIDNLDELFYKKGISWSEKGVKLKNLRFQIISKLSLDDFKKGSSWSEKGVKLFSKRSLNILKILVRLLVSVTIDELLEFLQFGSRDKLRELYLTPLRKDGLIELTIKDKPNAPNQKYIITEKGKLFLGGFDI
jgi:ATP-dependent DNA helicase RecG